MLLHPPNLPSLFSFVVVVEYVLPWEKTLLHPTLLLGAPWLLRGCRSSINLHTQILIHQGTLALQPTKAPKPQTHKSLVKQKKRKKKKVGEQGDHFQKSKWRQTLIVGETLAKGEKGSAERSRRQCTGSTEV